MRIILKFKKGSRMLPLERKSATQALFVIVRLNGEGWVLRDFQVLEGS